MGCPELAHKNYAANKISTFLAYDLIFILQLKLYNFHMGVAIEKLSLQKVNLY